MTSVLNVTTPSSPMKAPDACESKTWYYFIISSGGSLLGGVIIIVIARIFTLLWSKSRTYSRGDEPSSFVRSFTKGYLRVMRVCEELVSCQNFLGKLMTLLHVLSSIGSFCIYIRDTTLAAGDGGLERCARWYKEIWIIVDLTFNTYFLLHFVIRFIASRRKLVAWLTTMSIMDHLTIPPFLVGLVVGRYWTGLRFVRAFGLINIADCLQAINIVRHKRSIRTLELLSVFLSVWLVGSGFMHLVENRGDFWLEVTHAQEWSYFECMYFLLVTMSTVGYGDYSSQTYIGRTFSILFIISALGMFASFIPEMAENIAARASLIYKKARFEKLFGEKHIIVCGHINCAKLKAFMKDFLHQDRVIDKHLKIVVLAGFTPDVELEAVMKRYQLNMVYLQGTVMNVDDLERAKMKEADACIIMSDKLTDDPDAEDAAAIMKVIAIKDYESDVRILVQLLQYINKGYLLTIPGWKPQIGDMAVCLSELKLGFMAQNCLSPGFSTLLANLFTLTSYSESKSRLTKCCSGASRKKDCCWKNHYKRSAAFEVYTSIFSTSFVGRTFQETVDVCYNKLDLVLVAIDVADDSSNTTSRPVLINPTDENNNVILDSTKGYFIAQNESEAHRVMFFCSICHHDTTKSSDIGPCHCKGSQSNRKGNHHRKNLGSVYELGHDFMERDEDAVVPKSITLYDRTGRTKLADHQCNSTESGYFDNTSDPTNDTEADSDKSAQYDSTGLFHWCPAKSIESVVLDIGQCTEKKLENHVILCLFADTSSPLIGILSFVMPLRSATIPVEELKPVVIIGNLDYMTREWSNIKNFPEVYILSTGYGKGSLQGSPLSRAYLRAANIFKCGMCVILTSHNQVDDPQLADKEAILCTLNIKTTPKDVSAPQLPANDERPGELVRTITELNVDSNVQYLEQDDDTENVEIYMSQPYACGRVFTLSLLDSFMSTTYHSNGALAFVRAFVTGGVTSQLEQIFAEGCGLHGGEKNGLPLTTSCQNVQYAMSDPMFSYFKEGAIFGDLFNFALHEYSMVVMGLYRLLDTNGPDNNRRYVITNPERQFPVLPTDKVFCIKPTHLPKPNRFSKLSNEA